MALTVEKQVFPAELDEALPAEVEMILSAMEAGQHDSHEVERRSRVRRPYRHRAMLQLFVNGPDGEALLLFGRDVDDRSLGFITNHRLPLGYGGQIHLTDAKGEVRTVACTLFRCRAALPGWYEGALYFNREQFGLTE